MDINRPAVALFDKYADDYQGKYMDISLYHDTLDLFCAQVRPNGAHILELACGPGNITQYLLQKRPDFQILATDLSPNMLKLAQANNPNAQFDYLDCTALDTLDTLFDGIVCGFGLPYLSKEEALHLIGAAAERLMPNGLLYLSTMEDDYNKSGIQHSSKGDELYMYFHEAGYLKDAIEAHHLNILMLERKVQADPPVTDLILVAVKQTAHERYS